MDIKNSDDLIKKINDLKKDNKLDLSSDEDLSIAIMNLISLEEHLFFTYQKTQDEKYLEMLNDLRKTRTELMKNIVKNPEGEAWCISKHLLAASMRLMEVGTKKLKSDEKDLAKSLFAKSYELYSLFWGINLGLVEIPDIRNNSQDGPEITLQNDNSQNISKTKVNIFSRLGEIVNKILDCCRE